MADLRPDLLVLVRLVVAAALGGALGWERFTAGKWAGVRTHMLVAIASALFAGEAGLAVLAAPAVTADVRVDPLRVVQAVALGIGFLGAGIVHLDREGGVRGVTTAALIWATAAMGLAVGLGRYLLAAGATGLLLLVMRGVARLERPRKQAAGRQG